MVGKRAESKEEPFHVLLVHLCPSLASHMLCWCLLPNPEMTWKNMNKCFLSKAYLRRAKRLPRQLSHDKRFDGMSGHVGKGQCATC